MSAAPSRPAQQFFVIKGLNRFGRIVRSDSARIIILVGADSLIAASLSWRESNFRRNSRKKHCRYRFRHCKSGNSFLLISKKLLLIQIRNPKFLIAD